MYPFVQVMRVEAWSQVEGRLALTRHRRPTIFHQASVITSNAHYEHGCNMCKHCCENVWTGTQMHFNSKFAFAFVPCFSGIDIAGLPRSLDAIMACTQVSQQQEMHKKTWLVLQHINGLYSQTRVLGAQLVASFWQTHANMESIKSGANELAALLQHPLLPNLTTSQLSTLDGHDWTVQLCKVQWCNQVEMDPSASTSSTMSDEATSVTVSDDIDEGGGTVNVWVAYPEENSPVEDWHMHVYAAEVLSKFGRVQRLRQVMKGEVKHVMRKLPGVFVKVKTFVGLDAWVSVSDMADLVR